MSLTRTTAPLIGLAALAALALNGKPAAADTINFSGLTGGDGAQLSTPYIEGDFTVNFSTNNWYESTSSGNPAPGIYTGIDGSNIDVRRTDGTDFTFSSVDLAASAEGGGGNFTVYGFHGKGIAFGMNANSVAAFGTFQNTDYATTLIKSLGIIYNTQSSTGYLDNIVVQSAVPSVPEPSSIASLGLGALGLGGLVLRARKRKVQSA